MGNIEKVLGDSFIGHHGEDKSSKAESNDGENFENNGDTPDDGGENSQKQDPFLWIGETTADTGDEVRGELCELHSYDHRYNPKTDEEVVLRTGSKYTFEEEEEKSANAALVLNRHVDSGKVTETDLKINSPHIIKALKEVVGSYPGVNLDSERSIRIWDKPRCLFHYRHDLRTYAETNELESAKLHVLFLLQYVEKALHQEITVHNTMVLTDIPRIDYANLWMIFKPGALVYRLHEDTEYVYKFESMVEFHGQDGSVWSLMSEQVQTDGIALGFVKRWVSVRKFEGFKVISDLEIFPLEYHRNHERLRQKLTLRGKKYASLLGVHYRMYNGVQIRKDNTDSESPDWSRVNVIKTEEYSQTVAEARHRIMVDSREHNVNYRTPKLRIAYDKVVGAKNSENSVLNEEEHLLCHDRMAGFSLTTKTWGFFLVDKIQEIDFNKLAFDKLVLAQEKKDMVSALVRSGRVTPVSYDDMIKGKGKGIIFLLHGPPGVGKTYTVESICELTQRPLYTLSTSDLGMHHRHIEEQLTATLALATKWKAVVLIDEADVFMAERSLESLERNALVSILLRVVEYFEGVLFLTTNRVTTIDPAFKSRIHFTLAYPDLSLEAKCRLWKVLITQGPFKEVPEWADEEFLTRIAKYNMNGRQIKNTLRVSFALAHDKGRGLLPVDITSVLNSATRFEIT